MTDTIKIEKDFTIASKEKVLKMQAKMRNAFEELKTNREKLKMENDNMKFLQSQLKSFQDNYLSIYNLTSTAFFTIYEDLIIKELNLAAAEMLNYNRFEILGKPIVVFAEPSYRDRLRNYYHKVFSGQGGSIEINCVNEAGQAFPVLIQSALVQEDNSSVRMCISAVSNLTEAKQYQKTIEKEKQHISELVKKHTAELNQVLEKLQEQQQEYAELTERFNSEKAELKSDLLLAQKSIENISSEKLQLEQQIQDYTNKLEEAQNQIENFNNHNTDFEYKNNILVQEVASLKGQLNDALCGIEKLESSNKQLENEKCELESIAEDEKSKASSLDDKIRSLKIRFIEEVKKRNSKLHKAKNIIDNLKLQKEDLIKQWQEKLDETERNLNSKNNELSILNDKLQSQLSSVRTELKDQTNKSSWLNKKIKSGEEEIMAVQKELEFRTIKFDEQIQRRENDNCSLIQKLSEKSDELDFVKEELAQVKIDYEALNQDRQSLNNQIEIGNLENRQLKQDIINLRAIISRLCGINNASISLYNIQQKTNEYLGNHIGIALGYTVEQITGYQNDFVNQIMHPEDKVRISRDLKDFSWADYNETVEVEYRLRDAKNRWRYINCQEMIISRDSQGSPLEILSIQCDYTQKVETQKGMDALTQIMEIVSRNNSPKVSAMKD